MVWTFKLRTMRQKKILIYCTQLLETGGIENHILEFTSKMAAAGVKADIVVANFRMNDEQEGKIRANCEKVFLNKVRNNRLKKWWFLSTALTLMPGTYHTLYTNGQGESVHFLSKFIKFNNWVHHHHMSGDLSDQETWGSNYRRGLKEATTIVACSQNNAASIKAAIERDIKVIACFSRKVNKRRRQGNSSRLRFGYFGRLIPEKGIDLICRLSEDPDCAGIEFHLWGEGMSYPRSFFDNFPKVRFHGSFHDEQDLVRVINFLDAFLLLSIHPEGLPISLLESMSAGLPWLATDRGGIPDIACDPISTRVISHTSTYQEIKQSILDLASDIRRGRISSEKQRDLYDRQFSSEVLVGKWKETLQV